jgi:hypothetical protein
MLLIKPSSLQAVYHKGFNLTPKPNETNHMNLWFEKGIFDPVNSKEIGKKQTSNISWSCLYLFHYRFSDC